MVLSRQFKAVVRVGALFAGAWAAIGTVVSTLTGGGLVPSLLTYGTLFGALGGLSGIGTALLIARGESGKEIGAVPVWRLSLWGFLGGFTPGALFAVLAGALGATDVTVVLLLLGVVSGGVSGAISASAATAAKRVGPGAQP